MCRELDPQHTVDTDGDLASPEKQAFAEYNANVNEDDKPPNSFAEPRQQRKLSSALDKRTFM